MKVEWKWSNRLGSAIWKERENCRREQGPWRGQHHGRGWDGRGCFRQGQSQV